jgi:hypothetical protein
MGEPESPVETPEPDVQEEDAPEPEAQAPEEGEGEPALAVEPMLGLDEFLAAHPMKPAAAAMLRTWMRRQGKDSAGHYPLAQWEADYQAMLVGT